MTEPEPGTKNTAASGATVGIQGSSVHDSTVYITHPDAQPEEKYKAGVRYLDAGVPGKARTLIHDAIVHGHDNGEVRFHWTLAMLSKRSYRDLSTQDREQLTRLPEPCRAIVPGKASTGTDGSCSERQQEREYGQ